MITPINPKLNNYLKALLDHLRGRALDFYLALNLELSDRTKFEYCRVFTQLIQATQDQPIRIRSKR